MDKSSNSSGGVTPCNISNPFMHGGQNTNDTNNCSLTLIGPDLWSIFHSQRTINEVMQECNIIGSSAVWLGIKIFILIIGVPANMGLLWLLMSSKKALSASEVLGLNLSLLDIMYCLCLPVDIYTANHYDVSNQMLSAGDALSTVNLLGCPFLLACMCVERYLAAAHPVVYVRLGKWEYRAGVCALAWLITMVVMILGYFLGVFSMAMYLALVISVLFLIMLLCLVGIMCVLCKSGPGEGSAGSTNLKKRALKNILAVLVPSVIAYTPLLALVPFMTLWHPQTEDQNSYHVYCLILQLILAFPNFGLLIGPLFYLSRFRQLLPCWRKVENNVLSDSKSQSE